ncbi:hypothetical protein WNY61_07785 [Sulfitobacter sp. AS92]|uniref:hypothetical protein n=1 Tax=Sulfitobacter sp. AS92 TaxID=3135783 RepID=UPI00317D3A20
MRKRLARITGRDQDGPERGGQSDEVQANLREVNDRLREALGKNRESAEHDGLNKDDRSIRERLDDVLNKPRERLEIEDEREVEREVEKDRDIDRGPTHGLRYVIPVK